MSKDDSQYGHRIAPATSSSLASQAKTDSTIDHLTALLNSTTAAEELASSWESHASRPKTGVAPPRLQNLYTVLDSGRRITRGGNVNRGIPMWIVVRTCKAAWHLDGTWPLVGCDEESEDVSSRSVHPSKLILKSINRSFDHQQPPMLLPEPTCKDIAEAYRRRGIQVDEPEIINDDF